MKLKTKEFRKNNYFVLYEWDEYLCNSDCKDKIICYYDNWEELHKKILKRWRIRDLVYEFNKRETNIIVIVVNNRKYKLATFTDFDEEIE